MNSTVQVQSLFNFQPAFLDLERIPLHVPWFITIVPIFLIHKWIPLCRFGAITNNSHQCYNRQAQKTWIETFCTLGSGCRSDAMWPTPTPTPTQTHTLLDHCTTQYELHYIIQHTISHSLSLLSSIYTPPSLSSISLLSLLSWQP